MVVEYGSITKGIAQDEGGDAGAVGGVLGEFLRQVAACKERFRGGFTEISDLYLRKSRKCGLCPVLNSPTAS